MLLKSTLKKNDYATVSNKILNSGVAGQVQEIQMEIKSIEITKEEHLDYLESSTRLMLWFAREWKKAHPDEDFESIVRNRTDIWRKTSFFPSGPDDPLSGYSEAWLEILHRLLKAYDGTKADSDSVRFEEICVELLKPYWPGRIVRDIMEHPNVTQKAGYQCGSLRYNLAPDKDDSKQIKIHIANACYPGSLFEDRLYLPACLLVLTTQCAAKFGVTKIGTGTWLNSYPKWLALFPDEWSENMSQPNEDIRYHYGFWGQFLTSRRTFNHKLGTKFRKTGKMPYAHRNSWCSILSLRKHLESKYF